MDFGFFGYNSKWNSSWLATVQKWIFARLATKQNGICLVGNSAKWIFAQLASVQNGFLLVWLQGKIVSCLVGYNEKKIFARLAGAKWTFA